MMSQVKKRTRHMDSLRRISCILLAAVMMIVSWPVAVTATQPQSPSIEGKVALDSLRAAGSSYVAVAKSNTTLTVGGISYSAGVSVTPGADGTASLTYTVEDMEIQRFYAVVGPEAEGSANFAVCADSQMLAQSGVVLAGQSAQLAADIPAGTKTVTLKVTEATGSGAMNFADAGFYYTASADRTGVVYVSDMVEDYQYTLTGLMLDTNLAGNGTISIEKKTFDKGLSVHPMPTEAAVVVYDIFNTGFNTFSAYVGQCDTANSGGNGADCKIYVDGEEVYNKTFQYDTPAENVEIDVTGASQLILKVDSRGDYSSDAFSFGDAKFTLNAEAPAQLLSYGRVDLTEYEWKAAKTNSGLPHINTAYENDKPLVVGNKTFEKGFSLHPVSPAEAGYIEYDISSFNADIFTVKVGKTLETSWSNPNPQFTVKFRIYTDGKLAKESRPVVFGEYITMAVNVKGVTTLRLELDADSDFTCDCAAFCEPTLYYRSGEGMVHITAPYIKDTSALESWKQVTVEGIAPGVDELGVTLNGAEITPNIERDSNGRFTFALSDFAVSYNEVTVSGYVDGNKTSENQIRFQILGGNVLNLYQLEPYSVGTNGKVSFGTNLYNNKYLSIGGGALTSYEGISVYPNAGTNGELEVVYDLSLLPEYRYFRVAVGRDDWATIQGGQKRGTAKCYILSDAPGLSSPALAESGLLTAGTYEILTCEIPEGTTKLTLLTNNYDGTNISDYIDWFEPMLCKSEEVAYATAQTAMSENTGAHKTAEPAYSFAARFTTLEPSKGLRFTAKGEAAEITAKVYKFWYSRKRSMQETAIVEQTLTPDANGVYTLSYLTECESGEYLLVLEGVDSIAYSPSEQGKVYIDGACMDGFANVTVLFSEYADQYFGEVSEEGTVIDTTTATQAEKDRARTQFEGYLTDLSTFPASVTIGGTAYQGFGTDFTVKDTQKSSDDKRETTVITMEHTSGLEFELSAVLYPEYAAFDWVIYFTNPTEENSPVVTDFNIADMDFAGEDAYFYTSYGETPSITPYIPLNYHLEEGDHYFYDANTGRSSEEDSFPYYNLEWGNQGAFVAVGWPGWWETNFTYNDGVMNMTASQSALNAYLEPGETLRTPLMAFVLYDGRDMDRATNLWRNWFIDCNMYTEDGTYMEPGICGHTNWVYHEMLNTTEQQQLDVLAKYEEYGIDLDYWWMDAGWYELPEEAWSAGSPWLYSGNWDVDTDRFPTGLASIGEYAEENDIKNILWFEPERVGLTPEQLDEMAGDGTIKKEWLTGYEGHEELVTSWAPFNVLDLSDPEAVDWLIGQVTKVLENANISIYREDFNTATTPAWGTQDGVGDGIPDRSGITENKYVQGHLRYWDALLALDCVEMIDTCASGGHRLDLETLRRAVALHPADYDYSDQAAKQTMTYTISQWLPYSGAQVGYDIKNGDKYQLRSSYRALLALPYDMLSSEFTEEDAAVVKEVIAEYKTIDDYYYDDLYQLTDWNISPDRWYSYEYLDPEQSQGYAMVYRRDGENAPSQQYIRLKGLQEDSVYTVQYADTGTSVTITGKEAMEKGVLVSLYTVNSSELLRIALKDENTEALQQVEELIRQIGTVTENSGDAIVAARQAYDALEDSLKEQVTNYNVLTAAEQAYAALIAVVYGDVNADKTINAVDALLVLQHAVDKIKLTEQQVQAADVNGDAAIDAKDALLILQRAVDKIPSFPVENK